MIEMIHRVNIRMQHTGSRTCYSSSVFLPVGMNFSGKTLQIAYKKSKNY